MNKVVLLIMLLFVLSCNQDTPMWHGYNNPVPRAEYIGKFCINWQYYERNHHLCKSQKCTDMYKEEMNRKYNIPLDKNFDEGVSEIKKYCTRDRKRPDFNKLQKQNLIQTWK